MSDVELNCGKKKEEEVTHSPRGPQWVQIANSMVQRWEGGVKGWSEPAR